MLLIPSGVLVRLIQSRPVPLFNYINNHTIVRAEWRSHA